MGTLHIFCYSEMVVDPSYEELKICDSMAHIVSNGFSQLDNIKIEGKYEAGIYKSVLYSYCCILGSIGNESDIKRCLQEAPKMLLALESLLTSVCINR